MYLKDLKRELKQTKSLSELTGVYGQIASTRMRKIRGFVLRNREFLESITSIFKDTLSAYTAKLSRMVREGKLKEGGKVTFLAHNGKTVLVLVSANTGFFGDIVRDTFNRFIEDVKSLDAEVVIIGRVGRALFVSQTDDKPFVYFDLPDYGVNLSGMSEVIKHLVQYEEIRLYYGKFHSVIVQKPDVQLISAGTPVSGRFGEPKDLYIFEPSIEEILVFFETQVFASLFDQSLRESQLAKFASRILAMDRASQNVRDRIKKLNQQSMSAIHKINNSKQINSLGPVLFFR